MKKLFPAFLAISLSANFSLAGNWFGPGPWANGTYYAGNLDGKYQAAVSGTNSSGVLGFAIRDGAPPFLQIETQSVSDNALIADTVAVNQEIDIDNSLNYFAVFVAGRTYVGTTAAGVNYDNNSVFGSLIGTQPVTLTNSNSVVTPQIITNVATTNVVTTNASSTTIGGVTVSSNVVTTNTVVLSNVETVISTNIIFSPVVYTTGVDGSFSANISSKTGVFTFQGPGQLTAPGPVVEGQQTNTTMAFTVNGIRVSFDSQAAFQSLSPTTTATP